MKPMADTPGAPPPKRRLASWEWRTDPESLTWSANAPQLLGAEVEALGQDWQAFANLLHEADRPQLLEILDGVRQTGEAFEIALRIQSRGPKPVWMTLSGSPVPAAGQPLRLIGTLRSRERESRLEALLDATPDALVTYDAVGKVTFVNSRFTELFGWSLAEIGGRQLDFVPPERREELGLIAVSLLQEGRILNIETERLTRDGRPLEVELSAEIITDAAGNSEGVVVLLRDITHRKAQEREIAARGQNLETLIAARTADLRRSEEHLARLVDQSPLAIIEWDPTFHVRRWNQAAADLFGHTAEIAAGQHGSLLFTASTTAESAWDEINRTAAGQQLVYRTRSAGGQSLTTAWFNQRLLDDEGETVRVISFVKDITAEQEAQAALEKQATILENTGEAIISVDMDFIVQSWNRAAEKLYGVPAAEMIGRPLAEFVVETVYEHFTVETAMTFLRDYGRFADRARQTLKDGRELLLHSTTSLIKGAQGEPIGFVAVNQDIGSLVRAEQERDQLINILENTTEFVGICTPDQKITYINQFGRQMLGLPKEGQLELMALEVIAEEARETVTGAIQTAVERGIWTGEAVFVRRDGSTFPVAQAVMSHKDADGRLVYLSSVARDISEEREQQREIAVRLQLSQALARAQTEAEFLEIITEHTEFHPHVGVMVTRAGAPNEKGEPVHEVLQANLHRSGLRWLKSGANLFFPEFIEVQLQEGRPYVTDDMPADDRLDDRSRRFARLFGVRSAAFFPLFGLDNQRYGTLHLQTTRPAFFTPPIVDRYQAVAEEISITLRNIFLSAEVQRSLQRRSREFEITTQISQEVASGQNLNEVYALVVNRVHETFGFYYTQLLQYNPTIDAIGLVFGYGEVGELMRERNHAMPMGVGLIGRAAATGSSVLRPNVRQDPNWKANPLLPETRGELAVPIKFQDRVLGVLDVQADRENQLTQEDQILLEGLCGVVAVAIESTRLRQEMSARIEELNALQRAMSRESWNTLRSKENLGFLFDKADVLPLSDRGANGRAADEPAETASTSTAFLVSRPLAIRGEPVGTIAIQDSINKPLTPAERELLGEISLQVAEALENARLLEQTQRRAVEMEIVAQLSSTTSTILDREQLLKSVANLTCQSFGLTHTNIYLYDESVDFLRLAAGSGEVGELLLAEKVKIAAGDSRAPAARTFNSQKGSFNNQIDWSQETGLHPMLRRARSLLSIPIMVGGVAIGVIELLAETPNAFESTDLSVFTTLANQVAIALQNATLFQEQKETAEKLREVDRLKSEFLASMSHELRTPLNSIIGFADVLLEGIDGELNDRMEEDVLLIRDGGRHLRNLIGEILDMSKIEAGMMELSFSMVDLKRVATEVMATTNGLLQGKAVEAISEIADDVGVIEADRTRLVQILLNLLSNAAKFTDQGSIKLAMERQGPELLVRVQDSGVGIKDEDIPLVFQQFRQVGGMEHRKAGGTGLGMPITKNLVELHGGRIWLESSYGAGTTFFFTIPYRRPEKNGKDKQRYYA